MEGTTDLEKANSPEETGEEWNSKVKLPPVSGRGEKVLLNTLHLFTVRSLADSRKSKWMLRAG